MARVPLETFRLFAAALTVHQEVGGSLAPTLATVGRIIRDRIELTRRIRSLTRPVAGLDDRDPGHDLFHRPGHLADRPGPDGGVPLDDDRQRHGLGGRHPPGGRDRLDLVAEPVEVLRWAMLLSAWIRDRPGRDRRGGLAPRRGAARHQPGRLFDSASGTKPRGSVEAGEQGPLSRWLALAGYRQPEAAVIHRADGGMLVVGGVATFVLYHRG